MKNNVVLKVTGTSINRFIKRLIKNNINILNIKKISKNEINIIVKNNDLEEIYKAKGIYEIQIIEYTGINKWKRIIVKNKWIYVFMSISITLIILLSNLTFDIKIYHTNNELKSVLIKELKSYGIELGRYKKSFKEIEEIKENILNKYKEKIEWLEITRIGTTYKVQLEERIINKDTKDNSAQNIVAAKQGIIKKIYAKNGTIIKNENEYVSRGETIVSGEIYLNDTLKAQTRADAKVFAETWYIVKLEYPIYFYEENATGNKQTLININFLNRNIMFFKFKKFKNYKKHDNILYKNAIIPLSISIQNQQETKVIEEISNVDSVINRGLEYASEKIKETLEEEEYIISKKVLKNVEKNSTIYMEIFFRIYEDITAAENISPTEENI